MSFSSKKKPVPLQGPAGCLHAQLPGVLVLPPLQPPERSWSHKVQLTPVQAMAGEARGSQHLGDQAQKAAASAPEKISSAGSAPLPRELTKKAI